MNPILKVVLGPFKGTEINVISDSFSIGRDDNSNFTIKDIFVSSFHCKIKLKEDGTSIIIDDSANGTWVNGQKVNKKCVALRNKSTLGIGPVLFLYEFRDK